MSGWIKLHRGWRDCEMFSGLDEPFSEREAWVWLIENAAWKDTQQRSGKGEIVAVKRGQYRTSLRRLGEVFGWGKNKVSRYLDRLAGHQMIGTVAGQSGLIITICNYDKYQSYEEACSPAGGTVAGQSRDTKEEGKEVKEEKLAARAGEIDVPSLMMRLCRAAGIMPPDPGRNFAHHTEVLSLVEGWIKAGADPDKMEQCVAARAAAMPSPPRSLRYFDQPIRGIIAARAAQATEADRLMDQIRARKAA